MAYHAVQSGLEYGVPPSLSIAQAILETGWGKHVPGNNYFGMKGTGPAGTQNLATDEVVNGDTIHIKAKFRVYDSPRQSFDDHNRLLIESDHYKAAMAASDSVAMGHALTGIYATDPAYGQKLEWIIRRYRLTKFDPPEKPPEKRAAWIKLVRTIFDKFRDGWLEYIGGKPK